MTTRLRRLKELFFTARALSGQQLAAFLASVQEITLREELKALLTAAGQKAGILDRDPFAGLDAQPGPAVRYGTGEIVAGRYRVDSELAEGGFGRVYLAHDQRLYDRPVILKFPLAFPDHPEWLRKRLDREAESLARLHHPGVVGIIDIGETGNGHPFLVMHYVVGRTLREELSAARIGRRRALRILRQLGRALGAAHRVGILHQDLKPENIVLENAGKPDENAVIIDFGVASIRAPDDGTGPKPVAGSPDYLAPERMDGEASPASDIFSLGVIALEMLLGRLPKGWHPAAISLDRSLLTAVPAQIRHALGIALSRSPAQRFASPEEFIEALTRTRWLPRIAAALAALLLLAIGIAYLHRSLIFSTPSVAYRTHPVATEPGHQSFPALSPDGQLLFYGWCKPGELHSSLYVRDLALETTRRLTSGPHSDTNPVCSPDGRWIAFRRQTESRDALLMVVPVAGGVERAILRADIDKFTWFPDGSALLVSGADPDHGIGQWRMSRVDVNSGASSLFLRPPERSKGDATPAFSGDGRRLAFARYESRDSADLFVSSLDQNCAPKGQPRRLTHLTRRVSCPQWSPDGRSLFFVAGSLDRTAVWRIRASGGDPVQVTDAGLVRSIATARSARRLAYALMRSDSNIKAFDLAAPGGPVVRRRTVFASTADENLPRFSPDGKMVSFNSQRASDEQVWLARTGSNEIQRLSAVSGIDTISSVWNPADRSLAVVSRTPAEGMRVHWLSPPHFDWATARPDNPASICSISRDGNWVYYVAPVDGENRLFKRHVRDGTVRRVTRRPCRFATESPDGKTVYFCGTHETQGVWAVPPGGGTEAQIVPALAAPEAFAAGRQGLYYLAPGVDGVAMATLRYRRFNGGIDVDLARLQHKPAAGMALSPDERQLLLVEFDIDDTNILLLEGW